MSELEDLRAEVARLRHEVYVLTSTEDGASVLLGSELNRTRAELDVLRQHVAEEAARPVMVIDFDEAADVWCGTCPEHGEIVRTADDTADAHDEVVVALARHSHTEHGDDALVPLDMLAVPDALAQVRRSRVADLLGLAFDAAGVIASAEGFKHDLVCEHGRRCPDFDAHPMSELGTEPVGPQDWRDAARAWLDRFDGVKP